MSSRTRSAWSCCRRAAGAAAGRRARRARGAFDVIEQAGAQALTEMRRLLGLLRENDDELVLAPQPSARAARRAGRAGCGRRACRSRSPSRASRRELPPGVDVSAYRIVQEALTNALKHAGPARAHVTCATRPGRSSSRSSTTARGNGERRRHGPRPGRHPRARRGLGGELEAGPRPEGGYAVRARLPLGVGAMIRVLLADDQSLVRAGFRMILRAEPDIEVVGEAADGREAVAQARAARARRGADGRPDARARRHRGDAPDRDRRRRAAGARAHDVRPRRVRLRGAARRRERVPAQGRARAPAARRDPGRRRRAARCSRPR